MQQFSSNEGGQREISPSLVIDVMKVLALLSVVTFHYFDDWYHSVQKHLENGLVLSAIESVMFLAAKFGSQGIHTFFFASGFGLVYSEIRKPRSIRSFLERRIQKIVPAYVISLFIVTIVYLSIDEFSLHITLETFAANLSLLRNFDSRWITSINTNWWFVPTILQMYLAYIVCRKVIMERNIYAVIIVAWLVSFSYKIFITTAHANEWITYDVSIVNPYTAFFANYFWEFVAGAALARLPIRSVNNFHILIPSLLVVAIAFEAMGVALLSTRYGAVYNDDFFFIGSTALFFAIALLLLRGIDRQNLLLSLVAVVLPISYEAYLLHHPVSRIVNNYLEYGGVIMLSATYALFLIATYIVAMVVAHLVKTWETRVRNARK